MSPVVGLSRFGLDERQLAVRAPVQHADRLASRRCGRRRRRRRRPRPARAASSTDIGLIGCRDARTIRGMRARCARRRRRGAAARGRSRRRRGVAPARRRRFRSLPLAFQLLRLLRDLVDRLRRATVSQSRRVADAVQELLAARVQRDVGAVTVLLARQHDLRRDARGRSAAARACASLLSTSRRSAGVMST